MTKPRFIHLDLTKLRRVNEKYPPLSEAVWQALYWFSGSVTNIDGRKIWTWPRIDVNSICEVVKKVEDAALAYVQQNSEFESDQQLQEYCDENLGAIFLGILQSAPLATSADRISLSTGVEVDTRKALCAIALMQCERAAAAIASNNAIQVAKYMWEVHRIVGNLSEALLMKEISGTMKTDAQKRSLQMNQVRHETNRRLRAQVCEEWAQDPTKFPSAEKASNFFADLLLERGHELQPRTIADWLRAHAKTINVQLR